MSGYKNAKEAIIGNNTELGRTNLDGFPEFLAKELGPSRRNLKGSFIDNLSSFSNQ